MIFHVVALPNATTSKEYCADAFGPNTLNFCRMMMDLGHEVYHYGSEGNAPPCTEHVTVITAAEQERFFGHDDGHKRMFNLKWDPKEPYWRIMNGRASAEIVSRKQCQDFVCLIGGLCQKPIADAVGEDVLTVEYAVGYYGAFAKYCAFPSYTHQAAVYHTWSKAPSGRLYDAVIPHYYDPEDFPLCEKKEDYLLFVGRAIERKGLQIAVDTARASGMRLVMAGQGVESLTPEVMTCEGGYKVNVSGAQVKHVGHVGVEQRAKLMGSARALLLPTMYCEPFGAVVIEAAMCGTPALTTDFGAFAETVRHGVTGYRCSVLSQFRQAVEHAGDLDPKEIRRIAVERYSLDRVAPLYQSWFGRLHSLWDKGWPGVDGDGSTEWMKPR